MIDIKIIQTAKGRSSKTVVPKVDIHFLKDHISEAMTKSIDIDYGKVGSLQTFMLDIKSNLVNDALNLEASQARGYTDPSTGKFISAEEGKKRGDHVVTGALLASVEAVVHKQISSGEVEIFAGYHKDYGLNLELGTVDKMAYPIITPLWVTTYKDLVVEDLMEEIALKFKKDFGTTKG